MITRVSEFLIKHRLWVSVPYFFYLLFVLFPWIWTNTTIVQQALALFSNGEFWLVMSPILALWVIGWILALLLFLELRKSS